eukprot:TRINITY_DN8222_c0_g1_i5.p1 TRINITY_DN8222_c0_g1~~TRINITY_DN8222_c0_g1_i5.p1  ORF type:complete len:202 (-),score=34.25 TRINITY_DN8222_c0_g1_i5:154-759(-)
MRLQVQRNGTDEFARVVGSDQMQWPPAGFVADAAMTFECIEICMPDEGIAAFEQGIPIAGCDGRKPIDEGEPQLGGNGIRVFQQVPATGLRPYFRSVQSVERRADLRTIAQHPLHDCVVLEAADLVFRLGRTGFHEPAFSVEANAGTRTLDADFGLGFGLVVERKLQITHTGVGELRHRARATRDASGLLGRKFTNPAIAG